MINTIEEQGRNRLHVHIGIWIKMIQETLENLFNNDNIQGKKFRYKEKHKNESLSKLKKEIDHISSTDVITSTLKSCNQKQLNAMLKHNCIGDMRKSIYLELMTKLLDL